MPTNIAADGIDFGPVPDPNGGIIGALAEMLNERNANQQQLRGLAAGGVAPQAASPGPSLAQRLLGSDLDGTPYLQEPPGASGSGLLSSLFRPAGAASAPASPGAAPQPSTRGANPEVVAYLRDAAAKRGINPNVAVAGFATEGLIGFDPNGNANPGDSGSSFGPAQLHYGGVAGGANAGAGLGDEFTKTTGLDARDPSTWKQQIDFSLDHIAKSGWGPWNGPKKIGITGMFGVGQASAQATAQNAQPAPSQAAASTGVPKLSLAMVSDDDGSAIGSRHPYGGPAQPPQSQQAMPSASPPVSSSSGDPSPAEAAQLAPQPVSAPMAVPAPASAPVSAQAASSTGGSPLYSSIATPPSMSQIQAMIVNPATRAVGLQLWQQAVQPRAPIKVGAGETILTPGGQAVYSSPMKLTPGESLVSGTGQPIARAPGNMDVKETGVTSDGDKSYSVFNPQSGQIAPIAPADGQDAAVSASDIHGPDFLKTLTPGVARVVQSIAEGRTKLATGAGSSSPYNRRLRSAVLQYDPTFDGTDVEARYATRSDFAHGTTSQTITAGNTAIQHLADLSDAAEGLGNGSYPILNGLQQAAGDQTGGNLAGKQYVNALTDFAGEVTKFYRGTGGSEADIQAARSALNPNQSPDQIRTSIAQQAKLISGKVLALNNQWKTGMGPLTTPYPILAPESVAALGRIAGRTPAAVGGSPAPVVTGPAVAAVPAAPKSPIEAAKAAIAAGAPRAEVLKRLQDKGIDISGSGI